MFYENLIHPYEFMYFLKYNFNEFHWFNSYPDEFPLRGECNRSQNEYLPLILRAEVENVLGIGNDVDVDESGSHSLDILDCNSNEHS